MCHQLFVELLRGVVAHALLATVHCGNLENDGEIAAGLYGNGDHRDLKAEDLDLLFVQTKAVVHFSLYPLLKVDDKVDFFGVLDRAHAEQTLHVDDADGG